MPILVPCAAATAAGRLGKGGQITISQWPERSTSPLNLSKKLVVSAAVLYIFQLPAITGILIGSPVRNWFLSQCDIRSFRRRFGPGPIMWSAGRVEHRALPEARRPAGERIRGSDRWTEWWDRSRGRR